MWKPVVIASMCAMLMAACQVHSPAPTQAQTEAIEREIQIAFDGLSDAAKALDHDRYFSFFDAQAFSILNSDGTADVSLASFKDAFLPQVEFIERYDRLAFTDVQISVIDARTAILMNRYTADVVLKSGDAITATGAGAQVWSKRSGTWKLVHISNQVGP